MQPPKFRTLLAWLLTHGRFGRYPLDRGPQHPRSIVSNPASRVHQPEARRSGQVSAYLETELGRGTGFTVAQFVRAYEAGELDDADPVVSHLVGLLDIGQNGHRAA